MDYYCPVSVSLYLKFLLGGAEEVARHVKELAPWTDDMYSIPGTNMVEGDNWTWTLQAALWSTHVLRCKLAHVRAHTYTGKQTNK